MLSYEAARAKVIEVIRARRCAPPPATETVEFASNPAQVLGRIVAENIPADRNYPPFDRATRDGFALRAADATQAGVKLRLIGESRAGVPFDGTVEPGTCVHIMTGAAMPRGANTIVMVEHARIEGDHVIIEKVPHASAHFVLEGQETRVGESVIQRGKRLGYGELAMAAQVGRSRVVVAKKPRVAILSTGDEVISVDQPPKKFQIRNSNSISLAAQVSLVGGEPLILGNVPDDLGQLKTRIEEALTADIVVLTGGVSVGKYDHVEEVLRGLGAEFYFDAVAIRPGKPAVFGFCKNKPVFALPGNPVSTMVTFELFVVPAIELLSGFSPNSLTVLKAKLLHPLDEKPHLAHFLPARLSWPGGEPSVEAIHWEGSGDIGSVVRGNCFLVVTESKLKYAAGEWASVLPRRGLL
ncbi:MAG TPA: gephyrin-like molybdotransferase Glp [Candidatus Acidoferrales bacterium]|jgi:molybdopterin molybdotransferase